MFLLKLAFFMQGLILHTPADAAQPGLSLGASVSYFSYEEPGLMSEKGPMAGIEGQYLFVNSSQLSWRTKSSFMYGQLAYDGSLINIETGENRPIQLSTEDFLFHLQSDLGYQLDIDSESHWRFFGGLQMRHWQNEILGPGGYRRHTTALTLPLGLEFQHQFAGFVFAWEAQTQFWLFGQNRSYLSDARRDLPDLTLKQNSGQAFSLSLELSRELSNFYPFVRLQADFWRVADSEPQAFRNAAFFEPQNQTDHYQMIFGLHF